MVCSTNCVANNNYSDPFCCLTNDIVSYTDNDFRVLLADNSVKNSEYINSDLPLKSASHLVPNSNSGNHRIFTNEDPSEKSNSEDSANLFYWIVGSAVVAGTGYALLSRWFHVSYANSDANPIINIPTNPTVGPLAYGRTSVIAKTDGGKQSVSPDAIDLETPEGRVDRFDVLPQVDPFSNEERLRAEMVMNIAIGKQLEASNVWFRELNSSLKIHYVQAIMEKLLDAEFIIEHDLLCNKVLAEEMLNEIIYEVLKDEAEFKEPLDLADHFDLMDDVIMERVSREFAQASGITYEEVRNSLINEQEVVEEIIRAFRDEVKQNGSEGAMRTATERVMSAVRDVIFEDIKAVEDKEKREERIKLERRGK